MDGERLDEIKPVPGASFVAYFRAGGNSSVWRWEWADGTATDEFDFAARGLSAGGAYRLVAGGEE